MVGAIVGATGVAEGAMAGEAVGGFRRGDRRVGSGWTARPGVLFRVTRPWTRGVVLTTLGAVGFAESDGSTLGDGTSSVGTLGAVPVVSL
jgi:hypothetical protein